MNNNIEKCSFCGENPIKYYLPTPTNVIADEEGNIVNIVEECNLPICKECNSYLNFLSKKEVPKYMWVEKVLRTRFLDGRKRITDLILIPYLINIKKVDEKTTKKIISKWFELCDYSETKYEKKIWTQCRYVKRHEMKPLTFVTFSKYYKKYCSW